VSPSSLASRLTAEMCDPVFQRAMERGELGPDLDPTEVAEWLAVIQFILLGRLDFSRPDDPGHCKMLKTFVLLTFLPVDATEAGV
jgi:hypothetical protein